MVSSSDRDTDLYRRIKAILYSTIPQEDKLRLILDVIEEQDGLEGDTSPPDLGGHPPKHQAPERVYNT